MESEGFTARVENEKKLHLYTYRNLGDPLATDTV
jgi:hypothetical protein